ncbi:MAG: hypothetical protein PHI12_14930, partial [Dehalococcoidales bacterium]|nr:hypothetical protein [Dehalococcoidales bacterium]
GHSALHSNPAGSGNTALGDYALYANATGNNNTALGVSALRSNTTGYQNTALGVSALRSNTTGNYNIALGDSALYDNTEGYSNSALGNVALRSNTTGYQNTALGYFALYANTIGNNNTALGTYALFSNTTGNYNIALGMNAGRYLANGSTANSTPSNSVFLGYDTRANAAGGTNEIVIGASAIGAGSNSVVLGNDSITKTLLKGNVGIGTTTPGAKLDINGNLKIATLTTGATNTVLTHSGNIVQQRTIDSRVWGSTLVDYSGTSANYIPKMLDADTITNSLIYEAANGRIGISTTSPGSKLTVAGGASYFGALPAPTGVTANPASGGGLVAGTYYYVVNAFDANGLSSNKSSQVSCTVDGSTTTACQISWVAVPGAANYRVFGRSSNSQDQYWQTTSPYYTDTGAAGTSGTPPGPISAFFTGNIKAERFADSANDTYYLDPAYATLSLTTAGAAGIGYSAGQMSGATAKLAVDGNVGIGTTMPGQKLEVYGGHILVNGAGLTDPIIQFRDGTAVQWSLGMDDQSLGSGNPFIFSNGDGLGSPIMTLKSGNVGIGTTGPLGGLHVSGAGGASSWYYFGGNAGNGYAYTPSASFTTGIAMAWNPSTGQGENVIAYGIGGGANPRLDFDSWDGTTLTNVMTLKNGNVGIGTTNPGAVLHTYRSSPGATHLIYAQRAGDNPAGSDFYHWYSSYGPVEGGIRGNGAYEWNTNIWSTQDLNLGAGGAGNLHLTIDKDSGNVGIGTTGPGAKLDVSGTFRATATSGHRLGNSTDTTRALSILNSNLGASSSYFLTLGKAASNYNQAEISYYHAGDGSSSNQLNLGLYGYPNLVTISGSGNVGIGTTSPGQKLDVNGNGRINATLYLGTNSNNYLSTDNGSIYLATVNNSYFYNSGAYRMVLNPNGLTINNGSTGASSGVGLAVASGNVGIGT